MLKVFILMKLSHFFNKEFAMLKFFVFWSLFTATSFSFASVFSLNEDYLYFQSHQQENLSPNEISILDRYHFVFVAGFLNERARKRYFKDNISTLQKNKIENISVLFPSSQKSVSTNINVMHSEILRLYREGKDKPLIIFGHSKGGIEALATVLQDTSLLHREVSRIIAFQSPFNGNELFDRWLKPTSMHFDSLDGMNSLRGDQVYNVIQNKFIELSDEEKKRVSSSFYYISTSRIPSEMSYIFRLSGYLMMTKKVPSDGVVATKNMDLELFGQKLGHIKADHTEVVVAHTRGLNIASKEKTQAFTMALLKNILKEISPAALSQAAAAK